MQILAQKKDILLNKITIARQKAERHCPQQDKNDDLWKKVDHLEDLFLSMDDGINSPIESKKQKTDKSGEYDSPLRRNQINFSSNENDINEIDANRHDNVAECLVGLNTNFINANDNIDNTDNEYNYESHLSDM